MRAVHQNVRLERAADQLKWGDKYARGGARCGFRIVLFPSGVKRNME